MLGQLQDTKEKAIKAVSEEWSKRMAEEKRKNDERIVAAEQKLKRKQTELESLQLSFESLSKDMEAKNQQLQEQEERMNQTMMQFK